mgnify:CR=1 FL=1|tara:strand:+ start:1545 stop:2411 length:867 start_codon:yes stop_codon:yes gene_type:complete
MFIKNITILIVSYKSDPQLLKCLDNLSKFRKILILDNSNDIILKKKVKKKYPNIKFYISKKNLGYGVANNLLLKKVKSKYAIMLNPDSRISTKNVYKMISLAKKLNNKFLLITPSNKSYKLKDFFFEKKFLNDENLKNKKFFEIDTTHFYAPLINMSLQRKKKIFFDKNYFLYYEDMDFCKKIKNKNEKIYLMQNIQAQHFFGKSSNIFNYNVIRNFHWGWSTVYYYRKHYDFLNCYKNITLIFLKSFLSLFINKIILDEENSKNSISRIKGMIDSFSNYSDYERNQY